eukprot:352972-Chlamydomonas_euryale.AAC.4
MHGPATASCAALAEVAGLAAPMHGPATSLRRCRPRSAWSTLRAAALRLGVWWSVQNRWGRWPEQRCTPFAELQKASAALWSPSSPPSLGDAAPAVPWLQASPAGLAPAVPS